VASGENILSDMIIGSHFLLYSKDAEADRAFFRDVLGFRHVDAGGGWLIFAMSPAEAAIHPQEDAGEDARRPAHEMLAGVLYLMCDNLESLMADMKSKGVQCSNVETARWGVTTTVPLPSGGKIGLYQPRHKTALDLT
jgi:catechol 2,3-dioxygenase-like lactoylglutathione lyase family enzyme